MEAVKGTLEDWRLLQLERAKIKAEEYNRKQKAIVRDMRTIARVRKMLKKKKPDIKFEHFGRKFNDIEDLKRLGAKI